MRDRARETEKESGTDRGGGEGGEEIEAERDRQIEAERILALTSSSALESGLAAAA
jgi:hypothetical protein